MQNPNPLVSPRYLRALRATQQFSIAWIRLKPWSKNADNFFAVSTLSEIRGAFAVNTPQGMSAGIFCFDRPGSRLAVEIHPKVDHAAAPTL